MFDSMPKLLERCGTSERGTITGFYTILVDGDDMDEPVSDTVRGILDGHLVLSRELAQRYHYPAIDVLGSISRLASVVSGKETKKAVAVVRRLIADYAAAEDLINVGAYKQGTNGDIDNAISQRGEIEKFLIQAVEEKTAVSETLKALGKIAGLEIPDGEMDVYVPKMVLPAAREEEEFDDDTLLPAPPGYSQLPRESPAREELPPAFVSTIDPGPPASPDLPLMNF
jgi:flagellum-specific ATP synthase